MLPYLSTIAQAGGLVISTPQSLPNLSLWYNADYGTAANFGSVTANGGSVGKWKDLTGVSQDANVRGGAGKSPSYSTPILNGLGAVFYQSSGSNNLDINPITWAQSKSGFTIYVVGKNTALGASARPLTVSDGNLGMRWNGSAWQVGAATGLATASTASETSNWHIYGIIFDGSKTDADQTTQNNLRLRFRYDRADQTLTFSANPGTATSASASYFYFGGNNNVGEYMDGYLAEVLIWTRALTANEISAVENYINTKWGI